MISVEPYPHLFPCTIWKPCNLQLKNEWVWILWKVYHVVFVILIWTNHLVRVGLPAYTSEQYFTIRQTNHRLCHAILWIDNQFVWELEKVSCVITFDHFCSPGLNDLPHFLLYSGHRPKHLPREGEASHSSLVIHQSLDLVLRFHYQRPWAPEKQGRTKTGKCEWGSILIYWKLPISAPYVPHCQCRIHNHEHGQLAKGLLRIEQRYILSFRDELWVLLPKLGRDSRWPSMEYLKDRGHTLLFLLFWYHILVLNFSQWNIEILLWRAVS